MRKPLASITFLVMAVVLASGCVQESAVIEGFEWFQAGNEQDLTVLQPMRSGELEDNRIGVHFSHMWHPEYDPEVFPYGVLDAGHILDSGVKRVRLAINDLDSYRADWDRSEFSVGPSHDAFITRLADSGITVTYVLSFWDKAGHARGEELGVPRFKTEEETERYLEFVRFTVRHFRDRVRYYEIWNEPNIRDTIQWIEVEDYINLVRRAVAVIREEYPEARIVVGSTSSFDEIESQDYLFSILRSDVMPLIDVVEWHPMYGASPECDWLRDYYYGYPSLVQEIKDTASAHGFSGEYVADEVHWCTPDQAEPPWPTYSETRCAKYLTRCIVRHLGMDVNVSQILLRDTPDLFRTVQNLNTVMAGNSPAELEMEIESGAANIKSYAFSLTNGDKLVALWTDGVAVDEDPGVDADLTVLSIAGNVTGIDVLEGWQQPLEAESGDGNLVIRDLIVRDYPLIIRIAGLPEQG
jgi:hypothetical protein